jgi:hypothetical protein
MADIVQTTSGNTGDWGITQGTGTALSQTITYWGGETATEININGVQQGPNGWKPIAKGVTPRLMFKLWKAKLGPVGKVTYKRRLKKIEQLVAKYQKLGHNALAEQFRRRIVEATKLAEVAGAGIKFMIDREFVDSRRFMIRKGQISRTRLDEFTRVVPDKVLKKVQAMRKLGVFDDFLVYHYWDDEVAAKLQKLQKMSQKEQEAMADRKDPILFGVCNGVPEQLFFIADWDDEYCDLTFDELVKSLKVKKGDLALPTPEETITPKTV